MLQFNNTTNINKGLIQRCEVHTGLGVAYISGNSTLLEIFTGLINDEVATFTVDALEADGRYQFDDPNHTKQPVATFDLISGQSTYNFTTDEQSNQILKLGYITVKDANGNWIDLKPTDLSSFKYPSEEGVAYDEYEETSGTPHSFDIQDGTGIKLFPAPNYNYRLVQEGSAGGKVYFSREADYFTAADTIQTPGFPGIFHKGISYGASAVWLADKDPKKAKTFFDLREQVREELRAFYSKRNSFERAVLTGKSESFI